MEAIITSSNAVIEDIESDRAVGIEMLGYPTRMSAESNDKLKQTAGSQLMTPQLQVEYPDL